ncbi:MAG: Ig-like domain-containing protein [Candidatus Peribacteria bacterium]|jgi:uncharacterized protein YjdB|nr:Ig-like domain-containing protein [Candidatus Peribacteria bacterium]
MKTKMKTKKIMVAFVAMVCLAHTSWGQNQNPPIIADGDYIVVSGTAVERVSVKIVAEMANPANVRIGFVGFSSNYWAPPIGHPEQGSTSSLISTLLVGKYGNGGVSNGQGGFAFINYISWPEIWKNGTKMGKITHGGTQFSHESGITPAMFPVEQSGGYVKLKPNAGDQLELRTSVYFTNNGNNQGVNRFWSGIVSSGWAPGPFGSNKTNYTLPIQNGEYTYASRAYSTDIEYNPFYVEYASSSIPVSGVSLDKKTLTATLGDAPITLTATVQPGNATNQTIFWTSRNSNVATVSNGVVSFVGIGNAIIEVETQDGNFTDECSINVQAPQPTQYTIAIMASPTNGGTVSGGGTFDAGTTQSVVATPANGWEFVNWTENRSPISTSASYSFTLTGNRSLVAQFKEIPPAKYQVSFSGNVPNAAITLGNRTQAAGQYLFEDVAPGQYTYTIACEGYQTLSGTVEVVNEQVIISFTLVEIPPEVKSKVPIFEGLLREYPVESDPVALKIVGEGMEGLTFTYTVYTVNSKGELVNPTSTTTFNPSVAGEFLIEANADNGSLKVWTITKVN